MRPHAFPRRILRFGIAGLAVLALALALMGAAGSSRAAGCPPGTTPVEDVATGKVICERGDALGSGRPAGRRPGAPAKPGAPASPKAPAAPRSPAQLEGTAPANCGLSRWGCEEACQKTYLSTATGPASDAAQRAKVALAACLRVCATQFPCPASAPEVGGEKTGGEK